jgi:hypothetical protein
MDWLIMALTQERSAALQRSVAQHRLVSAALARRRAQHLARRAAVLAERSAVLSAQAKLLGFAQPTSTEVG